MISFTLDDLQPLLDGCASPLLLFEGDTLLSLNQGGPAVLSQAGFGRFRLGYSVGGCSPCISLRRQRQPSVLPGTIFGVERDLRVTLWKGHRLLEVLETVPPSRRVMASVAQGILSPLSGVMAAAPELLRQLPVQEDSDLRADVAHPSCFRGSMPYSVREPICGSVPIPAECELSPSGIISAFGFRRRPSC